MTVPTPHLHHIALTVRDLDASVEWYSRVFSLQHLLDAPHPGGVGRVLVSADQSLAFVLHHHDANSRELFSETRTGLDHPGLAVATRDEVVAWQAHLEAHGVERAAAADRPCTQSPIADEPYGSVLVFRDPDNIQLEICSLTAVQN